MSSVPHFEDVITRALDEDLACGPDATTLATVPAKHRSTAHLCAREGGVIAGIDIVAATIRAVAARFNVADTPDAPVCVIDIHATDGTVVSAGDVVATITAPTQVLLTAERTFLNLVCHLSGIATHTRAWSQPPARLESVIPVRHFLDFASSKNTQSYKAVVSTTVWALATPP